MQLLSTVAAFALAAAALVTAQPAPTTTVPATKDATIVQSSSSCPACPQSNCNKCTWGTGKTLSASLGANTRTRALIGFTLPYDGSLVKSCFLQMPGFDPKNSVGVTVQINQAEHKDWTEATVNGENAPATWTQGTNVAVAAYNNLPAVDISQICRSSQNRQFSIYISSPGTEFKFPSKESGNPAILHVTRYV
ncbi:hypothetical protein H4R18_005319 [Coemansia javaensis]|uniref:Carbohydrate-binding module family 96 domain-containing protein n=1 Tax=Coemansia javaensis TaxID=2761396 RepID=A0A9W8H5E9_9FUNG|nr:hypothetical protein H4R18_005319 [Coemansia javaensis]